MTRYATSRPHPGDHVDTADAFDEWAADDRAEQDRHEDRRAEGREDEHDPAVDEWAAAVVDAAVRGLG